jgi:hypothetical protein
MLDIANTMHATLRTEYFIAAPFPAMLVEECLTAKLTASLRRLIDRHSILLDRFGPADYCAERLIANRDHRFRGQFPISSSVPSSPSGPRDQRSWNAE